MFLFMCLQGMRISDTLSLNEYDIVKKNKRFYIEKVAKKTNGQFKVELHPIAKGIFDKWNGFNDVFEQDFNERIKEGMKEFFIWYKPLYEERFDDEYELLINKFNKKGKKASNKKLHKWEIVSSHYGRGTFISLLSAQRDKLTLKEIGTKTGQKDVRTIMGYEKPTREVSAEDLIPLNKIEIKEKKVIKLKTA